MRLSQQRVVRREPEIELNCNCVSMGTLLPSAEGDIHHFVSRIDTMLLAGRCTTGAQTIIPDSEAVTCLSATIWWSRSGTSAVKCCGQNHA